ncbi:MAG TPA: pyruvate kinase [Candidatus Limnocylindrales bacterium]|nr:pyruvate kinase [Candidatus Limnocylindrales bacterium]
MSGEEDTRRPWTRRTKLVCTLGPATADRVHELVETGMDVARLNFSHGDPPFLGAAAASVRDAGRSAGRPVALLGDLSGPKIRLGQLGDGSVALEPGSPFELRPDGGGQGTGDATGAGVTYRDLATDIQVGDRVLLADGAVELRVVGAGETVRTEVIRGGTIRSRAGVSIPSERLSVPALTDKDRADVPRAVGLGVDYIAQSFVRSAADVASLRTVLGDAAVGIVAKIETRPAVDDFDAILEVVDAVMIARGDLGVELPYEEVPIIQKQLVRRALDRGIPTIVATQMLESMVEAPRPTRAEASDVANAVFDGADAIMLSGETAIGRFPILAAEAAIRIARLCEEKGAAHMAPGARDLPGTDVGALTHAAVALARAEDDVAAIACYTRTGWTARTLAALRPPVPVLAFTPDERVVTQLALVHGVRARSCADADVGAGGLSLLARLLPSDPAVPAGAVIVLVASTAQPDTGPNAIEMYRVPGAP